jgi:PAP2 superfamily
VTSSQSPVGQALGARVAFGVRRSFWRTGPAKWQRRPMVWRIICCAGVYAATFAFGALRGFAGHTDMPRQHWLAPADRVLGFGENPSARLQAVLFTGRLDLLDHLLILVHGMWFIMPLILSIYLLLRRWEQFAQFAAVWLCVLYVGLLFYFLMPAAPPWMNGDAVRILALLDGSVPDWNAVAAFPSLHVAVPAALTIWMWRTGTMRGWAVTFSVYTALTIFEVVYLGEHYAVDVIAAIGLALVCVQLVAWSITQLSPNAELSGSRQP